MKCPQCQTNHKYRDGMTCRCGYAFHFDPKREKMTDGRFLAMVAGASAQDTYYFTIEQLYAQHCKKTYFGPMWPSILAAVTMALAAVVWLAFDSGAMAAVLFGVAIVLGLVAIYCYAGASPPDLSEVKSLVRKWRDAGRGESLARLIEQPALHDPPPEWDEPDIYDYGVERILLVQRDILVDLLVKNGFHAERRCLVLAESGYPDYLVPHARRLMNENRELPLFLAHDATAEGVQMSGRIALNGVLPVMEHAKALDLGLTPDDVRRLSRLRPLRPAKRDYALPLDSLPYAILSFGLAEAFEREMTLGELLAVSAADGGGSDVTSFG